MKPGDAWKTHAEHERDRVFRTGCDGRYVCAVNDGRRPAVLVCSECGDEVGLPQKQLRAGWGEPEGGALVPTPDEMTMGDGNRTAEQIGF